MQHLLPDYHVHTRFSGDSDAPERDILDRAISLSLPEICFTDHIDFDYPDCPDFFLFDTEEYFAALTELKKEYSSHIPVKIGVELGLQPQLADRHREFVQKYPFDFIIGSLHVIDRADPYYPVFWEGKKPEDVVRHYFEAILENIRAFSDFDVCGHLDYIVRYCPDKSFQYCCKDYMDLLDECLRELIDRGKGIEINTAGLRYGMCTNPHKDILCRYRELGGEIITVGADSHTPEHLAWHFSEIPELLKSCGFSYITTFEQRKPSFRAI